FKFIRYIREELLIVLGTSSSESALPRMLDKMEKLGCRKSVAGLALILGIDRFMSEARALTNLVGNGVATIVVAKWVKELDHKKLDDVLNNRAPDGKTHELSS
ncbi:cation:dicarboxylate symporter family transporter, partial [Escherichia coli]|uniref:cation:dicarboxylate symporter family transporter n=1 Tax=Escherichia coli TaxID=562 RepID=UPI0039EF2AC2